MPWSKVTAGGSGTTWSSQTASGSNTTWSNETGVSASWAAGASSRLTFGWLPLVAIEDLWQGVDFIPVANSVGMKPQPYKASTTRPAVVWNASVITASAFTAEHRP